MRRAAPRPYAAIVSAIVIGANSVCRATAPLVGAEESFIAIMSGMIPKGNGSRRRVDAYERSLMRARKSPEGLNVTTRRAETVAAIRVFGLRPGRSFFERTWKEPKE
jgi:hypothetical protein